MSISGTAAAGGTERRRIEEDNKISEGKPAAAEAPKTRSMDDALARISSPPTTVPAKPWYKKDGPALARDVAKDLTNAAHAAAHAVAAKRSDACNRALTDAEKKLMKDFAEAGPKLEKLEKDLTALAKEVGPAAKDVYEILHGLHSFKHGIEHMAKGIETAELGVGLVGVAIGYAEAMKGLHDFIQGASHLPHDASRALKAGPALDAVLRDCNDLAPTLEKMKTHALESAGVVTRYCVAG